VTVEEFFAWQERQPERYELVDGFPARMMTGAKNVHDDIVVNVLAELRSQLRGGGCRPFTSDGSIETKPGQIRRADIGADCGRRDPNATKAASPPEAACGQESGASSAHPGAILHVTIAAAWRAAIG